MKGFRRLSKVTGKLYLMMLLLAMVCMLINTLYICVDRSGVNAGIGVEKKITAEINKAKIESGDNGYTLPEYGLDLSVAIYDKMDEMLGYILAVAGIIFLLFMREVSFADLKSREFEQTLPVKKTTLVMHEYWFFFFMIIGVTFLQGIILYAYQTHYNNVWVSVSGGDAPIGFNGIPAQRLLAYTALYSVNLLLAFTWVYLGMVLCKNSLLGGAVSIGTMVGTYMICYDLDYEIADLITNTFVMKYPRTIDPIAEELWNQKSEFIKEIITLIYDPRYRFEYFYEIFTPSMKGFEKRYVFHGLFASGTYDIKPVYIILGLLIILFAGILLIWTVSKKRELSKGGRFSYFTICEYIFAVFCGIVWIFFLLEYVDYYISLSIAFMCITAFIVSVIVAGLIHPVKFNKKIIYRTRQGRFAGLFTGRHKNNTQITKLFYSEGRSFILFFIAAVIAVYMALSSISSWWYYYNFEYKFDFEDHLEHAPIAVAYYFESFAENVIDRFNSLVIIAVLVVLLVSKLLGYWIEKKAEGREFYETIPVKRNVRFTFSLVKDIMITVIPIILGGIYMYFKLRNDLTAVKIELEWLPKSMAGLVITDISYVIMIVGLLHFMEEMFPNGIMRLVGFIGTVMMAAYSIMSLVMAYYISPVVQFVYGVLTLGLAGGNKCQINYMSDGLYFTHSFIEVPVLYKGEMLDVWSSIYQGEPDDGAFYNLFDFSNPGSYMEYVLIYLTVGILLLALAHHFAEKKELCNNGFYFDFEKYMFSGIIAFTIFCIAQPYIVAWWHTLLVLILCVLIFIIIAYLMKSGEKRKLLVSKFIL